MKKNIKNIEDKQKEQDKKIDKNADFAECLYNNASAKREFCSHINSLAYKMTGGSTEIKDQLFHGIITKKL